MWLGFVDGEDISQTCQQWSDLVGRTVHRSYV